MRSRMRGLSSATSRRTVFAPCGVMSVGLNESLSFRTLSLSRLLAPSRPEALALFVHALVIAAFSAGFLDKKDFSDFDAFVESLAHVVDRERGGRSSDEGFHFDAGLGGGGNLSANLHAIFAHARVHINVSQRQWMTKRYPLGSALRGGNPGDSSDFKRISLWILELTDNGEDPRRHFHKRMGGCRAVGDRLRRHIHHAGFAAFVVMRESRHGLKHRLPQ